MLKQAHVQRLSPLQEMHVRVAIIGGGPAAHTAATYLGRAELQPVSVLGAGLVCRCYAAASAPLAATVARALCWGCAAEVTRR